MKVEMLYPEICCLYGDKANIRYLKQCVPDIEIIETGLNEKPRFLEEEVSLVYMGSTSEEGQKKIIQKLMPYKEQIKECIEKGSFFLFTGNAFEIFFEEIEIEEEKIEGLHIFPFKAKCNLNKRFNSLYLGKFQDQKIVGYTSRFSHTYGENKENFLFETIKGIGLNHENSLEGIHIHNFFGTYLLGPLLIQNPYFTKYLLKEIGLGDTLAFEKEVIEAYNERVEEFEKDICFED